VRTKTKIEYVWLDGYKEQNLRSKIKVLDNINRLTLEDIPEWSFDGSSTKQAAGNDSDCILKPVRLYKYHTRRNYYLVLCEVLNGNGAPHSSNTRARLREYSSELKARDYWMAFEQEYFMYENGRPIGWPNKGEPKPQGEFYCGVGDSNVAGRQISNRHLDKCLDSNIGVTGTNAEVALGQWEYQVFQKDAILACDDLWVSRYMLNKEAEKWGVRIEYHPKPIKGDWNGSGCHVNFSTKDTRDIGGERLFSECCKALEENHLNDIENYGSYNDERLTGLHETQHIDEFTWGVSDRGASIRIPIHTVENDWKGYLEDRRPASNCDPYLVATKIVDSLWHVFK
tara:strand:- start:44 stop:1066 length:1023 start_codon:yes stop_codon:yes gene_type:complete